jgi:glycosyltransferase involved in cell wall biosynthesis
VHSLNILFLSDVPLHHPKSGSEQVLYNQAIGLAKNGEKIFSITRKNRNYTSIEFDDIEGINDACYSVNTKNTFSGLMAILKSPSKLFCKIIGKRRISFVIAHQPLTFFSLLLARKLRFEPVIYIYHSPSHAEFKISCKGEKSFLNAANVLVRKKLERICLKKSSKIMALSHYMKSKVEDIHKIESARIIVNPGGCDLKKFKPLENREKAKEQLQFPTDKIHLLTIRNLEPRMGLDNLLHAIKYLKKFETDIFLTIGGEGPEHGMLEKLINKLDLCKEVTMVGFIPSNKIHLYYGAADFFVLPTRQLEGFGLVTLESMACGTPVLGTPVGGTKEILTPFSSAFLFRDSSSKSIANGIEYAINRYFNDQQVYEELRTGCRKYVQKNYSWQRHIDQLMHIISDTCLTNL